MTILGSVVGALVGASLGGFVGLLFGGLLGFVMGKLFDHQERRTRDLASRVEGLETQIRALRKSTQETPSRPAAAPARESVPPPQASTPTPPPPPVAPATPPAPAPGPAPIARAQTPRIIREPAQPIAARSPTWITRLLEGNIVAKVGVLILFLGVGFLLKYAYDRVTFPPQMRIVGVALAGAVMLWLGRRWLGTRRLYALILMGGALGVWYLDLYFALKMYALVSPAVAFVLFAALGVATALLAMRLEAKPLAALGLIGAFLAPIIASTGEGRYGLLFSYYTLLNLFILALSWFRSWRELNLIGFAFTFFIAGAWGIDVYTPADYALAQTFLVVFFLIYLVVPVLFALRQPPELRGLVDGTLVFGTPTVCAFLQWGLVRDMGDYALATSAGIAAAVYGALVVATLRVPVLHVLRDTYLSLAIALATLAVFFALDAYPTFAFWALEAAALLWLGLRQRQTVARVFALGLQALAILYFLGQFEELRRANPWFNDATLGLALIAVSAGLSAWLYTRYAESRATWEHGAQGMEAAIAGIAWLAMLALAFEDGFGSTRAVPAFVAAVAVSALAFDAIGERARILALRGVAGFDVVVHTIAAAVLLERSAATPLEGFGWIAWPLAVGCALAIGMRHHRGVIGAGVSQPRQLLTWILIAVLATWHGVHLHDEGRYVAVALLGFAGIVAAALRFVVRERGRADAVSIAPWILAWASVWWLLGIAQLFDANIAASHRPMALLMVVAATLAAYEALGSALEWSWLRRLQALFAVILAGWLIWHVLGGTPPLDGLGAAAWPLALALWAATLWRIERQGSTAHSYYLHTTQHVALWAIGAVVLTWGIASRFGASHEGVKLALTGLVVAVLLGLIAYGVARGGAEADRWPFDRHRELYRVTIAAGFAWVAVIWSVVAQIAPSSIDLPAPYLPLLNPIDFAQAAALLALGLHLRQSAQPRAKLGILGTLGFLWLNGIALRTIHFWADVPYDLAALLASPLVQAVLALLWTASALVLMTYASRSNVRPAWIAGAALLGIVIVKLFVNDIAQAGNVTRIVTFLGVGALLLAIGYFAPVPPAAEAERRS